MKPEIRPQRALTATDAWRRGVQHGSGLVISHISAQNPEREITLEVGQRDIRIHRSCGFKTQNKQQRGIRRNVSRFTNASKRRLLFIARNFPGLEIMLTLTYPSDFPMNGRMVKDHWRRFRQWMVRNNAATGLWVLEFQKRGAPHFHVFIREPLDVPPPRSSNASLRVMPMGTSTIPGL